MADVQHAGAKKVLDLISREYPRGRKLTYASAAEKLGRMRNHAKAVAQMCDLLDAAAAYSKTPLLALVAVRTNNGEINPKAWKSDVPAHIRDGIIQKSLRYEFGAADYDAIAASLDQLWGLGNHAAWKHVGSPGTELEFAL